MKLMVVCISRLAPWLRRHTSCRLRRRVQSEGDSEAFASVTADTGFSLGGADSPTLSSTVVGALGMGGVTSTVSVGAASAFAVAVTGPEGGMLVGCSSSPGPAAEESSGPKGKEGRNSDGMGRGAMPGRFRGGKEGRGGRPRTKMAQISHILPVLKGQFSSSCNLSFLAFH